MALLIQQQLLLTLLCGSQTASAFVSPHHHSRRLLAAARCNDHHSAISSNSDQHQRWLLPSSNNNLDLVHSNMITTTTRLHLFGNIFGNDAVEDDQKDLQENELARFSHLISNQDNPTVKFDSLSIMVLEWSKLFTDEKQKMGLTTPVVLVEFPAQESAGDGGEVTNYSGIQLLFKKGKTKGRSAYQDKDDEKLKEKGDNDKDTIKEGGVEVKVEQLNGGDLQVIASRCEIEEGTIVKEMSEQTIIDSLRKAMAAWKKEQPFS